MPEPTCIDLAEHYGSRYRIDYEPQVAEWPRTEHAWLARIRCQHGHVGVQGGERLHAFATGFRIGAQLRRLPYAEHIQRGDGETRIVFHVDHLDAVLAILRPRRRKQLTDAQRAALTATGAAHRFQTGHAAGVQGRSEALESSHGAGDVSQGRAK